VKVKPRTTGPVVIVNFGRPARETVAFVFLATPPGRLLIAGRPTPPVHRAQIALIKTFCAHKSTTTCNNERESAIVHGTEPTVDRSSQTAIERVFTARAGANVYDSVELRIHSWHSPRAL